jgi:DNA-binding NarL/FixJ family response regulator
VADDDDLYVRTLEVLLEQAPEMQLVGRARTGGEAVELVMELEPDVVLMDLAMPVMDGIEATATIRERVPQIQIVVLSGLSEEELDAARAAGADAYLAKSRAAAELVPVVLAIACAQAAAARRGK